LDLVFVSRKGRKVEDAKIANILFTIGHIVETFQFSKAIGAFLGSYSFPLSLPWHFPVVEVVPFS